MVAAPLSTRRRAIYAALALLSLFSVALVVVDPRAIGMTALLSGFLTLSYLAVYSFMRFDVLEER